MNVPGNAKRTIRRDFVASGVTLTSGIQVCIVVYESVINNHMYNGIGDCP